MDRKIQLDIILQQITSLSHKLGEEYKRHILSGC